jgi:hypothetical protein
MPAATETLFAGAPPQVAGAAVHVLITWRRRAVAPHAARSRPSTGEE